MAWTNTALDITFDDWFYRFYVPTIEESFFGSELDDLLLISTRWAPLYDTSWTDVMLWESLKDYLILSNLAANYDAIQAAFQASLLEAQREPTPDDIIIDIEEAIDEGIGFLDILINARAH